MKKRIFSMVLALVFVCMPILSVCAAPSMVAIENAAELYAEPEQVQVTEETEIYTVCSVAEDGSVVSEIEPVEEKASLSANLPKLPKPTDLRWNEDWREGNGTKGGKYSGFISWKIVPESEGDYKIYVYCNGQQVYHTSWSGLYDNNGDGRVGVEVVGPGAFTKSGTYTFKVVAKGDKVKYSDSDAAESKGYSYKLPSKKLATPQNIRFDNNGIVYFTSVENASGYMITMYNQNKEEIGCSWGHNNKPIKNQPDVVEDDNSWYVEDLMSWDDGSIKAIYATVIAITYDVEQFQNSDESAFSNAYNIEDVNQEISGELDEDAMDKIVSGELPADEALDNFLGYLDNNDLTNTDLAVSMLRDEDLANNIDTLEEKFIEQTGVAVDVKNTASDPNYLSDRGIDVNDISIKGAALNSENNNDVSLTFSEADPSHSADPKFYKNSVAVNIGMDGVTNSQKLDIPVIIEMPVPTGVVPHRLFILHYHADGSVEQIHPAIIEKGGKNYARFILTSFSTFIFCNAEDSVLMGNIYSDDETVPEDAAVSIKDLIALAQYVSGNATLSTEQLMVANVYTEDDIEGATVDVNINENDIELLADYISGNAVSLN